MEAHEVKRIELCKSSELTASQIVEAKGYNLPANKVAFFSSLEKYYSLVTRVVHYNCEKNSRKEDLGKYHIYVFYTKSAKSSIVVDCGLIADINVAVEIAINKILDYVGKNYGINKNGSK